MTDQIQHVEHPLILSELVLSQAWGMYTGLSMEMGRCPKDIHRKRTEAHAGCRKGRGEGHPQRVVNLSAAPSELWHHHYPAIWESLDRAA